MRARSLRKELSLAKTHGWDSDVLPGAKPCPFCGGNPKGHRTVSFWVACVDCGAESPAGRTPPLALAHWNRRAVNSDLRALLTSDERIRGTALLRELVARWQAQSEGGNADAAEARSRAGELVRSRDFTAAIELLRASATLETAAETYRRATEDLRGVIRAIAGSEES